jgi:hypothetical protein
MLFETNYSKLQDHEKRCSFNPSVQSESQGHVMKWESSSVLFAESNK